AAPGDHFPTQEGRYLVLTVSSDGIFRRLCEAMEQEHLLDDARFTTHALRWENIEMINSIVAEWILSKPQDEICRLLDEHGLAYSIAYDASDIVGDPHYAARGTLTEIDHPRIGKLKIPAPQPRMTGSPAPTPRAAPDLGS